MGQTFVQLRLVIEGAKGLEHVHMGAPSTGPDDSRLAGANLRLAGPIPHPTACKLMLSILRHRDETAALLRIPHDAGGSACQAGPDAVNDSLVERYCVVRVQR
jgi:hypothetical protein